MIDVRELVPATGQAAVSTLHEAVSHPAACTIGLEIPSRNSRVQALQNR